MTNLKQFALNSDHKNVMNKCRKLKSAIAI
jgi:hypothetical protein